MFAIELHEGIEDAALRSSMRLQWVLRLAALEGRRRVYIALSDVDLKVVEKPGFLERMKFYADDIEIEIVDAPAGCKGKLLKAKW